MVWATLTKCLIRVLKMIKHLAKANFLGLKALGQLDEESLAAAGAVARLKELWTVSRPMGIRLQPPGETESPRSRL